MRFGASEAQESLTPAAYNVLKTAYGDARRRGHNQVQPLHVAAILLNQSCTGSPLRNACLQSHPRDQSHPLQCRALELCFEVALERLPSNSDTTSGPAMSNALSAALKRAQAHQRRGTSASDPNSQPLLAVKVEMDQLIISILDDPTVSRVMKEAGFSSTEVKSSMASFASGFSSSLDGISQLRRLDRYSLTSSPVPSLMESATVQLKNPLFANSQPLLFDKVDVSSRPVDCGRPQSIHARREDCAGTSFSRQDENRFVLPESVPSAFLGGDLSQRWSDHRPPARRLVDNCRSSMVEDHCKHVEKTLLLPGKHNPVLLGDAGGAVTGGVALRLKKGDASPGLEGVQVLTFSISSLSINLISQEEIEKKVENLWKRVEGCLPAGVVICVGDIGWLVDSNSSVQYIVEELGRLLVSHINDRVWLLASASRETFEQFRHINPSLERRWALYPIHLTAGNSGSRSGSQQDLCSQCDTRFRLEISRCGHHYTSVHKDKEAHHALFQVKEETTSDHHKVGELRQKWHQHCLTNHEQSGHGMLGVQSPIIGGISSQDKNLSLKFPRVSAVSCSLNISPAENVKLKYTESYPCNTISSCSIPASLVPRESSYNESGYGPWCKPNRGTMKYDSGRVKKVGEETLLETIGTDLVLGQPPLTLSSDWWDRKKILPSALPTTSLTAEVLQERNPAHFGISDDLDLMSKLVSSVPWQKEAISIIAKTVVDAQLGIGRRGGLSLKSASWLLLLGHDKIGKRVVAKGLASSLFGGEKEMVWLDFNSNEEKSSAFKLSSGLLEVEIKQAQYRGKPLVDRLVDAIRKKPFSVIFLEDVDKADVVLIDHLIQALKRGKLCDSNSRDVSLANSVVVLTCSVSDDLMVSSNHLSLNFSERKLSRLDPVEIKVVIEKNIDEAVFDSVSGISVVSRSFSPTERDCSYEPMTGKRKAHWIGDLLEARKMPCTDKVGHMSSSKAFTLDLNLSAEENESVEDRSCTTEDELEGRMEADSGKSFAERIMEWARHSPANEFVSLVDATVVFKPFDFGRLVEDVFKQLRSYVRQVSNDRVGMQVDIMVLEQLVASVWQSLPNQDLFSSPVGKELGKRMAELANEVLVDPESIVKLITA